MQEEKQAMELEEGFLLFEYEVLPKCLVMMIKQRTSQLAV
jgi:hypothetical protein